MKLNKTNKIQPIFKRRFHKQYYYYTSKINKSGDLSFCEDSLKKLGFSKLSSETTLQMELYPPQSRVGKRIKICPPNRHHWGFRCVGESNTKLHISSENYGVLKNLLKRNNIKLNKGAYVLRLKLTKTK